MFNLLILAHDYPPYNSVGALRPASWAEYLTKDNIQVTVVSRNWTQIDFKDEHFYIRGNENLEISTENNLTTVKTPFKPSIANKIALKFGMNRFKIIRKIITSIYSIVEFYIPIGPKRPIFINARSILEKEKFDLIIATGEPFATFYYAYKLSKEYQVPWAADYRDLWTEPRYKLNPLLKYMMQIRERKIITNASFIITVSENLKKIIEKKCDKEILIVKNGFDEVPFKKQNQDENKLTISLAGAIYEWHPIKSVLNIISRLKSDQIQLKFYGLNKELEIKKIIKNDFPDLISQVTFHKRIPVQELLGEMSRAHFLLLFNDYSFLGTKIFNYLRTQRNILLCYTEDDNSTLLKENFFPDKTLLSFTNDLQEKLLSGLNTGLCIKNENELFDVLKQNLVHFQKFGTVNDYSTKKDISFLSRDRQSLILKNKILSLI
jgi:hypothetical protein